MKSVSNIALEYTTTSNEQKQRELLLLLVSYFLTLYDMEKENFADELGISSEFVEDAQIKFDYMKKIELTLQNMRETVQSEKDKDSEALTALYFNRILNTDGKKAKELAQIETAKHLTRLDRSKKIRKRWKAFSGCCVVCRAMDGVTVALDEPFMYQGQVVELSSGERYINNYAAMDTPNAHPNDKCSIEFIIE